METINKTYLGVDVGSTELIVSSGIQTVQHKFIKLPCTKIKNDTESINAWIEKLPAYTHVIFESTGTYSLPLAYSLEVNEISFSMLQPIQSKGFADTMKVSNRNDEIDASLLAIYGVNNQPECTHLESEEMHKLKQKRKHLSSLMAQKQVVDNQLHAYGFDAKADEQVMQSLSLLQATLQVQIDQFKGEIFTLNQESYQKIYDLMVSVVGIGDASANALIIATNGFSNFEYVEQVLKFIGLVCRSKDSSKSVRKKFGIAKSGVAFVRSCLYNAAKSAKRFNRACKELYENLTKRGKCHKVAMVAVMAKLVKQVFAVVKSNTPFDNNYALTK